MGKLKDRLGEINTNNQGLKMTIVEYRGALDIDVEFEDGVVVKKREYRDFKKGVIKNPYCPEIYDVGYIGVGGYKAYENGKTTKPYTTWYDMLVRGYSEKLQEKHPTYKGCTVCDEWHNFQVFAKWFENNLWDKDCTVLDKDILVKGNKKYSPNTCVLVDHRINTLFIKKDKNRGEYPIGVSYNKNNKKFQASCSVVINGKKQQKNLGYFNNPQAAFSVYKQVKEDYIKQVANEYKSKYINFPNELYETMCDYEVSIND